MLTIAEIKERVDLHDLAQRLGMRRQSDGRGNYHSPHRKDANASVSVYGGGKRWKDHATGEGGSCVDLVMYAHDCDVESAIKRLHDLYGWPVTPAAPQEKREKTTAEYIAGRCVDHPALHEYLTGRGISEEVIARAVRERTLGYNDWRSTKPGIQRGDVGYGGPAAAFIVKSLNPGHIMAVDMRYLNPADNGGVKTQSQGEKAGYPWTSNAAWLRKAPVVYIVESAINALSIESAALPGVAALATRGVGAIAATDWRFLHGKEVRICMDNDEPNERTGRPPGLEAAWKLYEHLAALNIAALLVDQSEWGFNDVNDGLLALKGSPETFRELLRQAEPWIIPGLPGRADAIKGKPRVFLPPLDFAQYWRYRVTPDFTFWHRTVTEKNEQGDLIEREKHEDIAGFRVAAITRVVVASAASVMSGEQDAQPVTLYAVSVQAPRHGPVLLRRVFDDAALHNPEQWKKLGPVFKPAQFARMVSILERNARRASRDAINFVGLAWRSGRLAVNEGPDCYFKDPEKQCPYHNLVFPAGGAADARRVVAAYQRTFAHNAATIPLVWAIGGHLKALLGFWPHLCMEARKGAGKSTLIKRLERTVAMKVFSGQSLQTEYRLLTSVSATSHPVGWEEISARRQEIIDKAVSLLQEGYQYTETRRGSEMLEYLICAPVLLAGEDVPVRSLTGKLVRTDLSGRKGHELPPDLPRFPLRDWLRYLAAITPAQAHELLDRAAADLGRKCVARGSDEGASRMIKNYAALLACWRLLCDYAGIDVDQGEFRGHLAEEMNHHIRETSADREPWVWILETLFDEISAGRYHQPWTLDDHDGQMCLLLRTRQVMHHLASSTGLRDIWNALPLKSDRSFKRQLKDAGVCISDTVERTIKHHRWSHLTAISLERLEEYGLHLPINTAPGDGPGPF